MSKIIEKYRKEAYDSFVGNYKFYVPWRQAILEAIFRPTVKLPDGKGPLTHLHPNLDKLHLPDKVMISDWRKYRVEDHPALVNFQARCHAAGLHDPFIRNKCWSYYPNTYVIRSRTRAFTKGLGFGFVVGGAIFLAEKVYDHFYPTIYEHSEEYIKKHGTGEIPHH